MADLFGNRGFWQDSGCVSTEKKEGKTEDSDLVLICFQISVWSGTTTKQLPYILHSARLKVQPSVWAEVLFILFK